jgi:hypothetical protein
MRDAWKDAKAAKAYDGWKASLRRDGKADRTILRYAFTVEDLLSEHPGKEPGEFTTAECENLLLIPGLR